MASRGKHTYEEITQQTTAWEDARRAFIAQEASVHAAWQQPGIQRVLFTGCGSTYYLSRIAAELLQAQTGVPATALPASEIVLFADSYLHDPEHTLLVTISRSGTTTETLVAQQTFKQRHGRATWCITCYPESPLALASDLVLLTVAAQEQSVAQTRSFASMLFVSELLAGSLGGEDVQVAAELPALGDRLIKQTEPLMAHLGERLDFDHMVFLGSGLQHGVANEAMLKMTEMSLSFSSAFHFLEYRHGPMSLVTERSLIAGLVSRRGFAQELQVMGEMRDLGAGTLSLVPFAGAADSAWHIELPQSLPDWLRPLLYLPPLQLLAYYRAMAKGLDPDNPRNLTSVIYLDAASLTA